MNRKISIHTVAVFLLAIGPALFSCHPGEERASRSSDLSWLDEFNIFVYGRPSLEYLEDVGGTAVVWSVYYGGWSAADQAYVDSLHAHGMHVASNYPTMIGSPWVVSDPELFCSASCRDIWGHHARALWIQPDPPFLMCHNAPDWQAFLRSRIEEHIDGRADAVHIDEPTGMGEHLYLYGLCDACADGFRTYLGERFSPDYLVDHFGIHDIAAFDYRDHLRTHQAIAVWGDPNAELRREFVRFQLLGRRDQIASLAAHADGYAGGHMPLSANTSFLSSNKQPLFPFLDLVVFENYVLEPSQRGKFFGTYLLGQAIRPGAPVVMFPDILSLALLSEDDWWLVRHWLAEAAAAGGSFLIPHEAYTFGGGSFHVPAWRLSPYTEFLHAHSGIYTGATRMARVAILYDYASALWDYLDAGYLVPWYASGRTHEGFLGAALALQEGHIPFEVIYTGDGELVDRPLDPADLALYEVVVIAEAQQLGEDALSVLCDFEAQGGHVLRLGSLPRRYWVNYWNTSLRERIACRVRAVGADLLLETGAPDTVGLSYVELDGVPVLHMINYNYDDVVHDFRDARDIEITLTLVEGMDVAGRTLFVRSPDHEEAPLDYTIDGDRLTFTVPLLHGYAMAAFE